MRRHGLSARLEFTARNAFTLVELLVVIGIIAVLISILLPALARARAQGRMVVCMSNLKQLSLGMFLYANDNHGYVPIWNWEFPDPVYGPGTGTNASGVMTDSNFVEQGLIWQYTGTRGIYVCPEYPLITQNAARTLYGFPPQWTYQANGQPAWCMGSIAGFVTPITRIQPDPNQVFMLMEQDVNDAGCWDNGVTLVGPVHVPGDDSLGQFHNGGGNFAYFDGHVEWMRRTDYLNRVSTANGTLALWGGYIGYSYH